MSELRSKIETTICTGSDSINWNTAFDIFDILKTNSKNDNAIMDGIGETALNGDRQARLNSLQLIDGILKNTNQQVVQRLIMKPVILGFANEVFTKDPVFHKALCSYSGQWVNIADKYNCCSPQFTAWQNQICSYKYMYLMTDKIAQKFTTELSACLELLIMFTQAMTNAVNTNASSNDPLLNEMLPNIHEIHTRLKELKPTISDKHVRNIITYIIEYCQAAKLAFSDFTNVGTCDLQGLNELASRGIPKRGEAYPKPNGQPLPAAQPQLIPQQQPALQQPQINQDIGAQVALDFGKPQSSIPPPMFPPPPEPSFTPPQQPQSQPQMQPQPQIAQPMFQNPQPQNQYQNPYPQFQQINPPQQQFMNPPQQIPNPYPPMSLYEQPPQQPMPSPNYYPQQMPQQNGSNGLFPQPYGQYPQPVPPQPQPQQYYGNRYDDDEQPDDFTKFLDQISQN